MIEMVALGSYPARVLLNNGWVPLVFALHFNAHAPPAGRNLSAPDILRDVIGRL